MTPIIFHQTQTREQKLAQLAQEITKAAIAEGMTTLYDDGVRKVMEGVTTIEEIMRVARQND